MKKLAIIADGWKRYVNYSWIAGCRKYILENNLDVEIDVFQCFGNFSMDDKHNEGEYNIINLPCLNCYDGIILEITNTYVPKFYNEIVKKIKDSGVPAVSLLGMIPGLYRAGIDNYSAMCQIVEHLIKEHGCRKINYVGGPINSYENLSRKRAYEDILKEHGIAVESERIFERDFEVDTGMKAFDFFEENNMLADAFVCANENIAVGVCQRAIDSGYSVPSDFCITGFDDFDKASYFEPRITTVRYSKDDVAYEAVRLLDNIWKGKVVPQIFYANAEIIFQDSCGCNNINCKKRSDLIKRQIFSDVRKIDLYNESMNMSRKLFECSTYEQMAEQLSICLNGLRCSEMYLVMNRDIIRFDDSNLSIENADNKIVMGYSDNMDVVMACRNGEKKYDIQKMSNELLPKIWEREKNDIRIFLPLHIREQEVGYIVLANCDYMMENQFVFETLSSFSKALEYLHSKIQLQKANDKLSELYILDSLTGLYNRMAYNKLVVPLFEKCMKKSVPIAVMFLDADHLKIVNDKYGHDMGNIIIKGVADAINFCVPKDAIAMRYGGDEFVVLIPDYDEDKTKDMVRQVEESLIAITAEKKLPFKIEASIGYVIARDSARTIDDYINEADEMMYDNKKRRNAQRI